MNDNTNKISNILPQVQLLKSKYDELAAVTGEHFNVFSILGVEADEVRTHSAFLADLLNPQGSHRQGAVFLKLFLELKVVKNSEHGEYKNPETFQVTKEGSTDRGRIDILLEKRDACIVIENKIYADDQDAQMERYYDYATSKRLSEEQIKLVYLTLDGSPPSKGSLGKLPEERVKCLSYSEDIINWLEECMKLQEVQRISSIREIVFQYRDLLKRLTGQSTNRRYSMELKDILLRDENYELIPDLHEMFLEFNVHVQLKFWEELAGVMSGKVDNSDIHDNQGKRASEENIRNYYTASTNRLYFGTTFGLDIIWEQTEIALRVELGQWSCIYYGFVLFNENGKRVESCDDEKFGTLAEKLRANGFKCTEWWIGRKSARNVVFPLDYARHNRKYLQCYSKRTELVEELVSEIEEAVNQLKKNLN